MPPTLQANQIKTLDDIRLIELDLSFCKKRWLQKRGWEEKCNNPASLWLWEKKINEIEYRGVDLETAIRFEQNIPPYEEQEK